MKAKNNKKPRLITSEEIELWVGSEPKMNDIIDDLVLIANGKWPIEVLRSDIISTCEGLES